MELEDFKQMQTEQNGQEVLKDINKDLTPDKFVEQFKADLLKQRKKTIYWSSMLVILSIFYFSKLSQVNGAVSIGYDLIGVGLILGAVYLYVRYRTPSNFLFTLPLVDFISYAEKRLRYMNISDWIIIIPLLLMLGTGGGIIFISSLLKYTDNLNLLLVIWILFFISLSVFGFYVSKKDWKKEHDSLLNELQNLK